MVRLAIGVIAALVLHVLLLMTTLPEQQIVNPEVKGTGHVTVNIVRPLPQVVKAVEEPVAEPDMVAPLEVEAEDQQEIEQIVPPTLKPTPRKPEPVEKVSERAMERKIVRQMPSEPVAEQRQEPARNFQPLEDKATVSAVEALQRPEALANFNRPPAYPSLARKRGWQGTVLLEVDVQRDGMVKSVQVKESSSYELLDSEALKAVRKWRFSPGLRDGEPVPMKVLVPVHFLLQDT